MKEVIKMKKTKIFENEESYDKWIDTNYEKEGGFDFTDNRVVVINSYRIINDVKFNGFSADATIYCKKPETAVKKFVKILKSYGYDISMDDFESALDGYNYYGMDDCGVVVEITQIEDGIYYINYMCFQNAENEIETQMETQKEQKTPKEMIKTMEKVPFMKNKFSGKNNKNDDKILKKLDFLERIGVVDSVGYGLKVFSDLNAVYDEKTKNFKCSKKDIGFLVNIINPINMSSVGDNKYKMLIKDEVYKLPYIIIDWLTLNTISAFNDCLMLIDNCGVLDFENGSFNGSVFEFRKILNKIGIKIIQEIEVTDNEYYLVYDEESVVKAIKKLSTSKERSDKKMITIKYNGKKYDTEIIGEYYDRDFAEIIHTHTNTPQEFFDEYIKLDPDFIKLFDYDFYPVEEQ